MAEPLTFEEFQAQANYQAKDWLTDKKTWQQKKDYDLSPYLVLPGNKFSIKLNNLFPYFTCWIKQRTEQFGDYDTFDLTDYIITFRMYDDSGNIMTQGLAEVNNLTLGEIVYKWKPLDITSKGYFTCDLEFKKVVSNVVTVGPFKLPNDNHNFQIIVN